MADEQQIERVDPAPRSVSGAYMGRVTNPDPERVYLLANPNDDSFGALASEADGWQYLVAGKDTKEKVTGSRVAPDGTRRLMVRGQYVMWRPKKEQDEYLARKHASDAVRSADARAETTIVVDGDKRAAE